jgi:hypothetical protein
MGDTPLVTYLLTNGQHLLLTKWVTKVKLDSNSLEVHPQLSHNTHLMDGVLVHIDLLWTLEHALAKPITT